MRRFVSDRIAAALERERPALGEYIAQHLQLPFGFPYSILPAAALIRDVRNFKIAALAKADLPPVRVEALLKIALANQVVQLEGEWDFGVLDADVELTAYGAVAPDGTYHVEPQSATLKAWWGDTGPVVASQWIPRG